MLNSIHSLPFDDVCYVVSSTIRNFNVNINIRII